MDAALTLTLSVTGPENVQKFGCKFEVIYQEEAVNSMFHGSLCTFRVLSVSKILSNNNNVSNNSVQKTLK